MNIENAARELLAHDGIFAVAISPTSENVFALADFTPASTERDMNDRLVCLCSSAIGLHRRIGLMGMSRLALNEQPFGSISVVTNMIDDVMVAVVVQSGHNICKSLQRMVRRAIARAQQKRIKTRMPSAEAVA